jgi:hypothetical protein
MPFPPVFTGLLNKRRYPLPPTPVTFLRSSQEECPAVVQPDVIVLPQPVLSKADTSFQTDTIKLHSLEAKGEGKGKDTNCCGLRGCGL